MDTAEAARLLSRLVDEQYDGVYRYAYRLTGTAADAEDLAQQTFLQAQRKLDQLRDTDRPIGWLLAITANLHLLAHRRQHGSHWMSLDDLPEPGAPPAASSEGDGERLRYWLEQMPEEFRLPLLMYFFESLSYREIADRLQVPLGTVMSRLSRGKSWLRSRLSTDMAPIAVH